MSAPIKRGGFARDGRTGQVVKVVEYGRGRDCRVAVAYKSDGYWCGWEDLSPATDPHAWGGKQGFLFLLTLVLAGLAAYFAFDTMTAHGLAWNMALVYAVPSGLVTVVACFHWFKLARP